MRKKGILASLVAIGLAFLFILGHFGAGPLLESGGTGLEELAEPSYMEEESIEHVAEEVKTTTATVLAVGDIMFHMPQVKAHYNRQEGVYDFKSIFKYVKKYIDSADLSIANFETVTAGNELGFSGFPRFNSPVETLEAIKYAGFDVLTTANNHILDQGKKGLLNTIEAIEKEGMKNVGTYREGDKALLIEEIKGIRIALLCYSYGFNGLEYTLTEEELSSMVNRIDEPIIEEDIDTAKELDADLIMVLIHWGNEYQREPSDHQIQLGEKMIEWGANIILGSHPHVIQRSDIINYGGKDNFIIYSMGNFLSNQCKESIGNPYTEDGIMVELKVEKDMLLGETSIVDINYIPTWVRRYSQEGLKYEILPIEDFLEDQELELRIGQMERDRIKISYQDTLDKMIEN